MNDLISRKDAVKTAHFPNVEDAGYEVVRLEEILKLPSAEPPWIPFSKRPLTDEEKADFPLHKEILNCPLPDDGQSILVTDGSTVWKDEYYYDFEGCYLDSGCELVTEATAWMPLPEPYEGEC